MLDKTDSLILDKIMDNWFKALFGGLMPTTSPNDAGLNVQVKPDIKEGQMVDRNDPCEYFCKDSCNDPCEDFCEDPCNDPCEYNSPLCKTCGNTADICIRCYEFYPHCEGCLVPNAKGNCKCPSLVPCKNCHTNMTDICIGCGEYDLYCDHLDCSQYKTKNDCKCISDVPCKNCHTNMTSICPACGEYYPYCDSPDCFALNTENDCNCTSSLF